MFVILIVLFVVPRRWQASPATERGPPGHRAIPRTAYRQASSDHPRVVVTGNLCTSGHPCRPFSPSGSYRRSRLLLIVFGVSLVLVAATGAALVSVVSNNVQTGRPERLGRLRRSIESALIETNLPPVALSMTSVAPGQVVQIQDQLRELLVHAPGILHVKIFAPDGTVLYSNLDGLRGRNLGPDDDLEAGIRHGQGGPLDRRRR